jgi:hypothetical protein
LITRASFEQPGGGSQIPQGGGCPANAAPTELTERELLSVGEKLESKFAWLIFASLGESKPSGK